MSETIGWNPVWNPIEYSPEFLDQHSKRLAELYMQIRALDDDIELANRMERYRTPSWIYVLPIIGGALGGLLGWFLL